MKQATKDEIESVLVSLNIFICIKKRKNKFWPISVEFSNFIILIIVVDLMVFIRFILQNLKFSHFSKMFEKNVITSPF